MALEAPLEEEEAEQTGTALEAEEKETSTDKVVEGVEQEEKETLTDMLITDGDDYTKAVGDFADSMNAKDTDKIIEAMRERTEEIKKLDEDIEILEKRNESDPDIKILEDYKRVQENIRQYVVEDSVGGVISKIEEAEFRTEGEGLDAFILQTENLFGGVTQRLKEQSLLVDDKEEELQKLEGGERPVYLAPDVSLDDYKEKATESLKEAKASMEELSNERNEIITNVGKVLIEKYKDKEFLSKEDVAKAAEETEEEKAEATPEKDAEPVDKEVEKAEAKVTEKKPEAAEKPKDKWEKAGEEMKEMLAKEEGEVKAEAKPKEAEKAKPTQKELVKKFEAAVAEKDEGKGRETAEKGGERLTSEDIDELFKAVDERKAAEVTAKAMKAPKESAAAKSADKFVAKKMRTMVKEDEPLVLNMQPAVTMERGQREMRVTIEGQDSPIIIPGRELLAIKTVGNLAEKLGKGGDAKFKQQLEKAFTKAPKPKKVDSPRAKLEKITKSRESVKTMSKELKAFETYVSGFDKSTVTNLDDIKDGIGKLKKDLESHTKDAAGKRVGEVPKTEKDLEDLFAQFPTWERPKK